LGILYVAIRIEHPVGSTLQLEGGVQASSTGAPVAVDVAVAVVVAVAVGVEASRGTGSGSREHAPPSAIVITKGIKVRIRPLSYAPEAGRGRANPR
jgi:hypothetical protein